MAAQDISGASQREICKDFKDTKEFDPEQVTSEDEHYVWVGGTHRKIYKLDAKTGAILMTLAAPVPVYGAALAGDGKLWIGAGAGGFGFLDTSKCTDQASCEAAPLCSQRCSPSDCKATCDNAVKARLDDTFRGYGITVDHKQRVWRSGWPEAGVFRYDPHAAIDKRMVQRMDVQAAGGGIAADANGWVWAANHTKGLVRINAKTLDSTFLPHVSKGVAVDMRGRVFGVAYAGAVHVVDPGPGLTDNQVRPSAVKLKGVAYAYSDMTGVQTRLASNAPGWYRSKFNPCTLPAKTEWAFFEYDVEVPPNTWAMFNVRTADTEDALATAPWRTIACIAPPGGKGRVPISMIKTRLIEAEVRLVAAGDLNDPTTIKSARIKSYGLLYQCIDPVR